MPETAAKLDVQYCDEQDIAALHRHYPVEIYPQPVVIELDIEAAVLYAAVNPEIGNARPMSVFHRRTLRWDVGFVATTETANRLLTEIEPHAQIILGESSIEWDGSNHVGRFTATAEEAIEAVERVMTDARKDDDPSTFISEYLAGDWFVDGRERTIGDLGLSAATTDEQIRQLAQAEEREALTLQEPSVLLGVEEHLLELRNELRDQD